MLQRQVMIQPTEKNLEPYGSKADPDSQPQAAILEIVIHKGSDHFDVYLFKEDHKSVIQHREVACTKGDLQKSINAFENLRQGYEQNLKTTAEFGIGKRPAHHQSGIPGQSDSEGSTYYFKYNKYGLPFNKSQMKHLEKYVKKNAKFLEGHQVKYVTLSHHEHGIAHQCEIYLELTHKHYWAPSEFQVILDMILRFVIGIIGLLVSIALIAMAKE